MKWKGRLWAAAIIYGICIVVPTVIIFGSTIEVLLRLAFGQGSWGWLANILIVIGLSGFFGMMLLIITGLIDYSKR